ncbi:hypothetical protein ACIQPT_21855 [Streptomyces sp. NPDC091289]|uniref:hypothetical protein n=1 Tax=Streptomyces sp. NPDC091289 TaxID=3365989 RepID=UPI00382A9830
MSRAVTGAAGRTLTGVVAASAAAGVYGLLRRRTDAALQRTNRAGRTVTLYAGPAAVIGTAAGLAVAPGPPRERLAGVLAVLAAGGCGAYDDLMGADDPRRGFRAHLGALRRGEVTSGAVKLIGIGAAGLAAGLLVEERAVDGVLTGVVAAGTAHLVNLVDVTPGAAVGCVALLGAAGAVGAARPAGAAGGATAVAPLAVAGVLAPADLGERAMLGDTGAHALGAALGLALARCAGRSGRLGRVALVAGVVAAAADGDRVSRLARRVPRMRRHATGDAGAGR